jgi:hypothetical protein
MSKNPLAEVFGFRPHDQSEQAVRFRKLRLCPFNNKIPNCTKDKADNPLGVCSINEGSDVVITCPVRFRQDWLIMEQASKFFFSEGATWTSLSEVRLVDRNGKSAGNIDLVLVEYDKNGRIIDFGSLEIQAVYVSGNIRRPFERYLSDPKANAYMDWSKEANYPRPDHVSSSRKRLAPQLLFKGGILNHWRKKMAVAVDRPFFSTLPTLPTVPVEEAEMAWLIYELVAQSPGGPLVLQHSETIYTAFADSLTAMTQPEISEPQAFIQLLQTKLESQLKSDLPPENTTLQMELG